MDPQTQREMSHMVTGLVSRESRSTRSEQDESTTREDASMMKDAVSQSNQQLRPMALISQHQRPLNHRQLPMRLRWNPINMNYKWPLF